jgi:hypothetical protein
MLNAGQRNTRAMKRNAFGTFLNEYAIVRLEL